MEHNEKPAAANGGHREIAISDWKPHSKNTLHGFFTASLPGGLVLHGLMLHQKGEVRWIAFPAEFADRPTTTRLRAGLLAALNQYLGVL